MALNEEDHYLLLDRIAVALEAIAGQLKKIGEDFEGTVGTSIGYERFIRIVTGDKT